MANDQQVFVDAANVAAGWGADERNALLAAVLVAIEHPGESALTALELAIAPFEYEEE